MEVISLYIRHLTTADYDQFYKLRLAALEEHPEAFATDAQAWQTAAKETIERLLTTSQDRADMPILGAWVDDSQLVGMVGINRDLRPSVAHKATLWGGYVTADYRQQGIGYLLLREMLTRARAVPDLLQIRAVVNASSLEALALLGKMGFEQFGREPNAKKVDRVLYDQIYLWHPLSR